MGIFSIVDECFDGQVKTVRSSLFNDNRGFYEVTYREDEFAALGLPTQFVQDNFSRSRKNVVRGLHFQLDPPMGKLMRVTRGEAFLVAVDINPKSPNFLMSVSTYASEWNRIQMWAPGDFARGFCALSDPTDIQYKTTAMQNPLSDFSVKWNDPAIGIPWPTDNPILSDRDKNAPTAKEFFARHSTNNHV
jgi:dTDP-4-dehydrorhamnose 3,5-epimerase